MAVGGGGGGGVGYGLALCWVDLWSESRQAECAAKDQVIICMTHS